MENSLFHGLSDEKEQIHVVVKFEIVNQDMMITITDDGVGFTDENCRKLNQKMRENRQSNMIGMNNIRDRLKTTLRGALWPEHRYQLCGRSQGAGKDAGDRIGGRI